jgi:outer membrane protein TolC
MRPDALVVCLVLATTQETALADERTAVDILGRRMVASVLLLEALGGGWSTEELPSRAAVAAQ